MEEVTSKREWSPDDQKNLLNRVLVLGGNSSKKSYKAVESSLIWEDIKVHGKSAEECKAMYHKLISKVRKYRIMQEIISDAFSLITDEEINTAVNEVERSRVPNFLYMTVDVDDIKEEVDCENEGHIELNSFLAENSKQEQEYRMFYGSFNIEGFNTKNIKVESEDSEMSEMGKLEQPDLYGEQKGKRLQSDCSLSYSFSNMSSMKPCSQNSSENQQQIHLFVDHLSHPAIVVNALVSSHNGSNPPKVTGIFFKPKMAMVVHQASKYDYQNKMAKVKDDKNDSELCVVPSDKFAYTDAVKTLELALQYVHREQPEVTPAVTSAMLAKHCNGKMESIPDDLSECRRNMEAVTERMTQPIVIDACSKVYECYFCGVEFNSGEQLEDHKRTHSQELANVCDICGAGFTQRGSLKRHKRIHTGEKPHKCDICGVGFSHSGNLKGHMRIHTGERPYKCDVCGFSFSSGGNLKVHKRVHTGEKPYKCDVCDSRFSHSGDLKVHKRMHTGEKPYKCDVCGLRFSSGGRLKTHKRIHTGEKPCKCDICGVALSSEGSLKIHKRIHTGEKPYKCNVCNVPFSSSGDLIRHERIHTGEKPYRCDVCSVSFARSEHLKQHLRTHTGEKPYKCDICHAGFSFSGNLKVHKRIHTGEKPYKCDVCGVGYSRIDNLKKHKIMHT